MLKLKVKKIVVRGEQKFSVLGFEGVKSWENLPNKYTSEGENFFLRGTVIAISFPKLNKYIGVGTEYSVSEFNEILSLLRGGAKRLEEITKLLAAENAGWEGYENYLI